MRITVKSSDLQKTIAISYDAFFNLFFHKNIDIVQYLLKHSLADIYEQAQQELSSLDLESKCIGGGRIDHNPEKKEILVYGYSMVIMYYLKRIGSTCL